MPEPEMKEMLKGFMNESLKNSIQIKVLTAIAKLLYEQLNYGAAKSFEEVYKQILDAGYQDTIVQHPFLDNQWKEQLKKDLNDVSGLDLS